MRPCSVLPYYIGISKDIMSLSAETRNNSATTVDLSIDRSRPYSYYALAPSETHPRLTSHSEIQRLDKERSFIVLAPT